MAYRLRLPEQMHRQPKFDIRSRVHKGIDFDVNGHFTPIFDGIIYLMIPQWANVSSIEDLKKVKMNIYGHEIDFSRLDFSRFDQKKLKSSFHIKDEPQILVEEEKTIPIESKSWFNRWFGSATSPPPPPVVPPPPSPPSVPLTRKIHRFLIRTICSLFISR